MIFTEKELKRAEELAYDNWNKSLETDERTIGFEYLGQWISNVFIDSSGRFPLGLDDAYKMYGKENVDRFIKELLNSNHNFKS